MRMTEQQSFRQKPFQINCLKQLYTEQAQPSDRQPVIRQDRFQVKNSIVRQNHHHLGLRTRQSSHKLCLVNKSIMERANDKLYVGLYNPNYGQVHS